MYQRLVEAPGSKGRAVGLGMMLVDNQATATASGMVAAVINAIELPRTVEVTTISIGPLIKSY